MMAHRFISIAFTMLLVVYLDNSYIQLLIVCLSCFYHYFFLRKLTLLLFLFLACFVLYLHRPIPRMTSTILRIDEIRESYVIASHKQQKCVLYNIDNLNLYDIVEVVGNYTTIHSTRNLGVFHFATYLQRKGITQSMYVNTYEVKAKAKHMKAKLYRHIASLSNSNTKENLQMMLYRQYDQTRDYQHFLFASGLHLSFIISILARITRKERCQLACLCSLAAMMLLPYANYMLRIFIFGFIPLVLSNLGKREQFGVALIVLLLIQPNIAYEVTFIIPVLIRFVSLFTILSLPNRIKQWLVLIPVQLYCFYEVNIIALLFFPLLKVLQTTTFLLGLCAIALPSFGLLFNSCMHLLKSCLNILPLAYTLIGKPFFIWLIAWLIAAYYLISKRNKKSIMSLLILLLLQTQMKNITFFGEVTFIDIGQGDCILIREPLNGKVMLIDIGNKINQDLAKSIVYPILKAKGIKTIDKVVITHDDYDHNGGLPYLQSLMWIKEIITTKQDIHLKYVSLSAFQSTKGEDSNDKSIILYAEINKLRYLFTGDASKQVELEMLDTYNQLQVDILKVGHHGSNTSSDRDFIAAIHPLISVISSGYQNQYRHPHQEVIKTLKQANSYILNTQHHGSISIFFHPLFNIMLTANHKITLF